MEINVKLINYLNELINQMSIRDIEFVKLKNKKIKINQVLGNLSQHGDIDIDKLIALFDELNLSDKIEKSKLEEIKYIIFPILKDPSLSEWAKPQIEESTEYISDIENLLNGYLNALNEQINKLEKLKKANELKVEKYTAYLNMFNGSQIISVIPVNELQDFFDFLKSLPKDTFSTKEIFDLVVNFSKYNLNYYKNLSVLKSDASLLLESCKDVDDKDIQVLAEELNFAIKNLDIETISNIKQILAEKVKLFTPKVQKEFESQTTNINIENELNEEENDSYNYFISQMNKLLDYYDSLEESEKNILLSMYTYINEKNEEVAKGLSNKYSINYVKYLFKLVELRKAYSEYVDIKDNENELIMEFTLEQTIPIIKEAIEKVRLVLKELPQLAKMYKDELKIKYVDSLHTEKGINLQIRNCKTNFLFLSNSLGEPYPAIDQEVSKRNNPRGVKDIQTGLSEFVQRGLSDIIMYDKKNLEKIKGSDGIKDYSDLFAPHKLRQGISRIAFIRVRISQKNQITLCEYYKKDKFELILVLGFGNKDTGSDEIYRMFNKRIAREAENIAKICELFETDFTDQTYREAIELINTSYKQYEDFDEVLDESKKLTGGR